MVTIISCSRDELADSRRLGEKEEEDQYSGVASAELIVIVVASTEENIKIFCEVAKKCVLLSSCCCW